MNPWLILVIGCAVGGLAIVAWLIGCVVQESARMERYRDHHWMTESQNQDLKDAAIWRGYKRGA